MDITKERDVIQGFRSLADAKKIVKKLHYKNIEIVSHANFIGQKNYLIKYNGHYLLTKHKVFKDKYR
jgi:hypothetical protein